MARGKPNPFNPLDVMDVMEEICEGVLASTFRGDAWKITPVGVDVLAQQSDLLVALSRETLHLKLDGVWEP